MKSPEATPLPVNGFSLTDEAKFMEVAPDGRGFHYNIHRAAGHDETIVFDVGRDGCVVDVVSDSSEKQRREPTLPEMKKFLEVVSVGFPNSPLTQIFIKFVRAQGSFLLEAAASAEAKSEVLRSLNAGKE